MAVIRENVMGVRDKLEEAERRVEESGEDFEVGIIYLGFLYGAVPCTIHAFDFAFAAHAGIARSRRGRNPGAEDRAAPAGEADAEVKSLL